MKVAPFLYAQTMKENIKKTPPAPKILRLQKMPISTLDGFTLIDIDSILYLESDNNYTIFYLCNGAKIIATKNLGYYEQRLSDQAFVRIHNSFIVNLNQISRYTKADGGKVILLSNKSLPVSRHKKSTLLQYFK